MKSWQNYILLNNLFLTQNNEIKKDLTNKNILMKNSSFDSSFNSVKNINNNIISAIVRASRSFRVSRDHLRLIRIFKILNLNSLVAASYFVAKQSKLGLAPQAQTGVDAILANKELSIAQLASLKKFKLI